MPTTPETLEAYLYDHIPISRALGARVLRADTSVIMRAPIDANINHKHTVFGGSLQAVATLACWALLHINLRVACPGSELVITRSTIDYLAPVTADFEAVATLPDPALWDQFKNTFARRGKARVMLKATIHQGAGLAVDYTGTFAALRG